MTVQCFERFRENITKTQRNRLITPAGLTCGTASTPVCGDLNCGERT